MKIYEKKAKDLRINLEMIFDNIVDENEPFDNNLSFSSFVFSDKNRIQ